MWLVGAKKPLPPPPPPVVPTKKSFAPGAGLPPIKDRMTLDLGPWILSGGHRVETNWARLTTLSARIQAETAFPVSKLPSPLGPVALRCAGVKVGTPVRRISPDTWLVANLFEISGVGPLVIVRWVEAARRVEELWAVGRPGEAPVLLRREVWAAGG